MKLRCTSGSLRLRVRKSDIAQLRTAGVVRESLYFSDNQVFMFELMVADVADIHSTFEQGCITVRLPCHRAQQWMDSNEVGLECHAPLHILIEKDFPCRHTNTNDRADTFYELEP